MDPITGIIGLIVLFFFMFIGVPIGFAMGLVGFAGYVFLDSFNSAMSMVGMVPYTTVASYTFSVLPLFLLMGEFSTMSGLMRDAYRSTHVWLGHLPGGMAMATIGGCASFAAVCGSSIASAATMTRICLPEMRKYKYDPGLATGSLAAGGTLGILIPPSLGFIIYGMITEESIGRLFMAGIFPGILLSLMFMLTIYIIARINPLMGPAGVRSGWRQRITAIKDVWGVIILFILVMGGIWGGIFTPTEAAAVGALVSFLFVLGRRKLTKNNLIPAFQDTIKTTGMIYVILIGAMIFGYFMTVSGLPMVLADFVGSLPLPPMGILVAILVVYIFLGCLLDALAMILITMPIFLPVLITLGFDLIWFGVLSTLMSELALITPPIGMNVFVISGMVDDIPMHTIFRGILPFAATMILCVAILVAFPQISLFLPNIMIAVK